MSPRDVYTPRIVEVRHLDQLGDWGRTNDFPEGTLATLSFAGIRSVNDSPVVSVRVSVEAGGITQYGELTMDLDTFRSLIPVSALLNTPGLPVGGLPMIKLHQTRRSSPATPVSSEQSVRRRARRLQAKWEAGAAPVQPTRSLIRQAVEIVGPNLADDLVMVARLLKGGTYEGDAAQYIATVLGGIADSEQGDQS